MQKIIRKIIWMHCNSCALSIEMTLKKIQWIHYIGVNYANEEMQLEFDEEKINLHDIKNEIEKLWYTISDEMENNESEETVPYLQFLKMIIALILTWIVVVFAMWDHIPFIHTFIEKIPTNINYFIQGIFTGIVMFWSGSYIFVSAYKSLLKWIYNMNVLVSLWTGAAFFISIFSLLFPEFFLNITNALPVYFEAAAWIAAFIILWKYIEDKAKKSTRSAVKSLLKLQEKKATIFVDGKEKWVGREELKIWDILIIKPWEKTPADAIIIDGSTSLDESLINGESTPANKTIGEEIFAWSINIDWYIKAQIYKPIWDNVLDNIIKLVKEASGRKPSIQNLVDKVSSIFVPVVIIIAILTFFIWIIWGIDPKLNFAILTSISVLVIACPCALWLATPTALSVGIWKMAKSHILIKNPEVFEKINDIKHVFFDKTWTLTTGKLEIIHMKIPEKHLEKKEVISLLYALESKSTHPIAKSIVEHIQNENRKEIEIKEVINIAGAWIQAIYNGNTVLLWSLDFLEKNWVNIYEDVWNFKKWWNTVVALSYNGTMECAIAMKDTINPESQGVIDFLRHKWIKTYIISWDNEEVVKRVALQLGVDGYYAKLLPDDKYNIIKNIQNSQEKVIMIWDGINDAPSLTLSDIWIAIWSGSDIAISSGDIIFIWNKIEKIKDLFIISKNTLKIIKQNLFWAFLYNIVLIPVAAWILYPIWGIILNPMFAWLSMVLSSISVVLNSLRIK